MPNEAQTSVIGRQPKADKPDSSGLTGLLVMLVVTAVFGWNFVPAPAQTFLARWWYWELPAAVLLVVAGLLFRPARAALTRATVTGRAGLFVFVVLAIVVVGVVAPTLFLEPNQPGQPIVVRSIFLFVVCLLPAVMYYLFIATRKYGLLNEFITNLAQLGLLAEQQESVRRLHILTYLRKFEAVYGPIGDELVDRLLEDPDPRGVVSEPDWSRRTAAGITNIFTAETTPPLVIATILIALGWLLVLPPIAPVREVRTQLVIALSPVQAPVQFAFLGAYFFAVQMLFHRYVRRDLRASAYVQVSLRIIIAVIAAWVLDVASQLLGLDKNRDSQLYRLDMVAFAVGVFPPILWQFLAALFKKLTFAGIVLPSMTATLPLSDLDGLTVWHESRLEEEDIENVPNMATASLVELMLNTRFPADRIVDWVDQAILYTHLGAEERQTRRQRLREHGIRTATCLQEAYRQAATDLAAFEQILDGAGKDRSKLRALMDVIETNPNLALVRIWKRMSTHQARPLAGAQAA